MRPERLRSIATAAALLAVLAPTVALGPVTPAFADSTTNPDIPPRPKDGCSPASNARASQLSWAQKRLDTKQVWQLTRGAGVTVAVIDSGVDRSHPQLAGRVKPGLDVVKGSGSADTDPCTGHGTFVAGIIAAAPVEGTPFAGVAPEATILPYRQSDDSGKGTPDGLATSVRRAVTDGATVINISVAINTASDALKAAIEFAESHDVVVVASVANEAGSGNPVTYPSGYPTVLGIGAVDSAGKRASFSGVGDFVDLVGPGVDVVSTSARGTGHNYDSGTSFAAPYVTGVAALVRAYHPKLSAAAVRHRLLVTADHPARNMPDTEYGWGMVNPYAAVTTTLPEEAGAAGAQPSKVALPAPAQHPRFTRDQAIAMATTGGALLLTAVGLLARPLLTRGRRRGWAAGSVPDAERTAL